MHQAPSAIWILPCGLLSIAAGGALGWGAAWLEDIFYLVFLYPLALGFGLGTGWALLVHRLGLRVRAAVIVASLIAPACWLGLQSGRLAADRATFTEAWQAAHFEGFGHTSDLALLEEDAPLLDTQAEESAWQEWLGSPSTWREEVTRRIQRRLEAGVRTYGAGSVNAAPWLAGAMHLAELTLMLLFMVSLARAMARTPRCAHCDAWLHGTHLGFANADSLELALEIAAKGETLPSRLRGGVPVFLETCLHCSAASPFVRAVGPRGQTLASRAATTGNGEHPNASTHQSKNILP